MNTFLKWLENFQLKTDESPPERHKKIWVSDPNNPQQVNAWLNKEARRTFTFPLNKEKFIHFTPAVLAPQIIKSGVLNGTAFAISANFGKWFPGVQYTHIKDGPIVAILFRTNKTPNNASGEEVIWHDSIPLIDPKIITNREAINILKHTPHGKEMYKDNDRVEYI